MKMKIIDTAKVLVADDKGLLAMDENNPTCNKRFAALGISQTVDVRRAYRQWIVTTPTPWRVMLLCARKPDWFLLSNRKFLWTAYTPWSGAQW